MSVQEHIHGFRGFWSVSPTSVLRRSWNPLTAATTCFASGLLPSFFSISLSLSLSLSLSFFCTTVGIEGPCWQIVAHLQRGARERRSEEKEEENSCCASDWLGQSRRLLLLLENELFRRADCTLVGSAADFASRIRR
jgi:hypothetical protein